MLKRLSWLVTLATLALFFGVIFSASMVRSAQTETAQPKEPSYMDSYIGADATQIGSATCLKCHPKVAPAKDSVTHFTIINDPKESKFKDYGCEGCHGPGSKHNGNPKGILNPNKMSADEVVGLCSKCHEEKGSFDKNVWLKSKHAMTGKLSCLSCHSGHSANASFLIKDKVPDLCLTCHAAIEEPFEAGKHNGADPATMVCTNCHNPHK